MDILPSSLTLDSLASSLIVCERAWHVDGYFDGLGSLDLCWDGSQRGTFQPDNNTWRSLTAVSRIPSSAGLEFNSPYIRVAVGPSFVSHCISRPHCLALRIDIPWADVDKEKKEVYASNDSVKARQLFQ